MSANQKRPKSKKLNTSTKKRWQEILKDVEKKEVPIHVLDKLIINLNDGTAIIVEIKNLIEDGIDPEVIEDQISEHLENLADNIFNVDFFVDVKLVEKTVQPETDKLLSKL
jgi:ATP:corrinoid adenosyltransferase